MKRILVVTGIIFLFFPPAYAEDKVVVIPLFSESADASTCVGTDEVLSNNRCWKDRNLGADQVATSPTDAAAYGDLYQWGRPGDGHQNRTSSSEAINSANDVPGHNRYIAVGPEPYDWRVPQNDILWQGLSGVNNPCPQGFRLPTEAEWEAERASWSSNDAAGAFASPLKLVMAGYRSRYNGTIYNIDSNGYYWSSTVSGTNARNLYFKSDNAFMYDYPRAHGFSIRCIKD